MQSIAPTVDQYVRQVPDSHRPAITGLRNACRTALHGYEEAMQWGMPAYSKNGVPAIAFASQKQYIALYVMDKAIADKYRTQVPNMGKSCIRYRNPEQMDFAVIKLILGHIANR